MCYHTSWEVHSCLNKIWKHEHGALFFSHDVITFYFSKVIFPSNKFGTMFQTSYQYEIYSHDIWEQENNPALQENVQNDWLLFDTKYVNHRYHFSRVFFSKLNLWITFSSNPFSFTNKLREKIKELCT